jgi:hypothetical protein
MEPIEEFRFPSINEVRVSAACGCGSAPVATQRIGSGIAAVIVIG